MEVKSIGKFVRVSTRKARIPANIVKGMNAVEAMYVLKYMPKGSAHYVRKVLSAAIANAVHNFGLSESGLVIKDVLVDKGPSLRRVEYKAKGSISFYNRPMSHITVVVKSVDSQKESKKVKKVNTKSEKSNNEEK